MSWGFPVRRPTLVYLWAARDVLRRPGENLLVGLALATLLWAAGTIALLTDAVRVTAFGLIDAGPSLVVRRLGPAGFSPFPVTATTAVAAVPGALMVRTRLWGPARAEDRAIEVVGLPANAVSALVPDVPSDWGRDLDDRTDPLDFTPAIAGPAFALESGAVMTVFGPGGAVDVEIEAVAQTQVGLLAQDTFIVAPPVARRVLGLADGMATDLALDVFQESEEDAIRADIARALPFPIVITTRGEAKRRYATSLTRRGGIGFLMLLPAALAVGALVAMAARERTARSKEVGLLKALGWTTRDIVAMHGLRAMWVAIPAVSLGWLFAWLSVFGPGVTWPGALLFGWSGPPPVLDLDPTGALVVLIEVTAVAVLPWLAASIGPAIVSSSRDPWTLLNEDPS